MDLTIQNFKSIQNKSIQISRASHVLITGPSGSGKSTILTAISWCLYGVPKSVSPAFEFKGRTMVKLDFGGLRVTRYKKPELLQVELDSKLYVDATAQSIIDDRFGSHLVWKSCCYLSQGDRNALISISSAERFDVLSTLAYGSSGTMLDSYHETLVNEISKVDKMHKISTIEIQSLDKQISLTYPNFASKDIQITPSDIAELKTQTKAKIAELESQAKSRYSNIARKETLEADLAHLKRTLDAIPEPINVDIDTIRAKLSMRPLVEQIRNIKVQDPQVSIVGYTESDLVSATMAERDLSKLDLACRELGISRSAAKQALEEANLVLAAESAIKSEQERSRLLLALSVVPESGTIESLTQEIQQIEHRIAKMQQSLSVLSCPECNTHLRYIASPQPHLRAAQDGPVNPDLIHTQKNLLATKTLDLSHAKNRDRIQRELSALGPKVENNKTMQDLIRAQKVSRALGGLNLNVNPPPVSSAEIKRDLDAARRMDAYLKDLAHRESLVASIPDKSVLNLDRSDFQILEQQVQSHERDIVNTTKKQSLTEMITRTQKELSSIHIEPDQADLLSKTRSRYRNLERLEGYLKLKSSRDDLVKSTGELGSKLENLEKCKSILSLVQNECLDLLVANINSHLSAITSAIFNEPIQISLSLSKTAKSTGRTRDQVHLNVTYKGYTTDNPFSVMSGGEGDRLSVALTLALQKCSGTPLLMLDETTSSLDQETRDTVYETVKSFCPECTVLNIVHDGVEGVFDSVIAV